LVLDELKQENENESSSVADQMDVSKENNSNVPLGQESIVIENDVTFKNEVVLN
jgi:hypothetical protein